MTIAFGALCLWAVLANIIALFPSRRKHWPAAYALLIVGTPLLIWVLVSSRPAIGAVSVLIWAAVLRWPLLFALRWLRRRIGLA